MVAMKRWFMTNRVTSEKSKAPSTSGVPFFVGEVIDGNEQDAPEGSRPSAAIFILAAGRKPSGEMPSRRTSSSYTRIPIQLEYLVQSSVCVG